MIVSELYTKLEGIAMRWMPLVLFLFLCLIFANLKGCFEPKENPFHLPHQPDTIHIKEQAIIAPIPIANHYPITTVTIYAPDTITRKHIEKNTILLRAKYEAGKVEIETISPIGEVKKLDFAIPETPSLVMIDAGGISVVEDKKATRKKRWKGIWKGTKIVLIAGAAGFITGTILTK